MRSEEAFALREQIAQYLNTGAPQAHIATALNCSRTTVQKVDRLLQDPHGTLLDGRSATRAKRAALTPTIETIILDLRRRNPTLGPRMLHAVLQRRADALGLDAAIIPAPATIGRLLQREGLAYKPVGPKDARHYPDEYPREPGTLTIDGWGPWHLRAQRLYLCTVQDRRTRLALAMPALGGVTNDHRRGLSARHWSAALLAAAGHLIAEGVSVQRVYSDNGIGMVPAFGTLTAGARTALALGARLIFIPPGQPWRNGKLERFHWSREREYFRPSRPQTLNAALDGLLDWLNYYNIARPHSRLRYRAPGDLAEYVPLSRSTFELKPEPMERVAGVVECIRMVLDNGEVELWGTDRFHVSDLLAGQYVRTIFEVPGPGLGRVVYVRKNDEQLVVATFNHHLDEPGYRSADGSLVDNLRLVDFAPAAPPNERLDMEQLANQRSRVLKRRAWLEDRTTGEDDNDADG